MSGFTQMTLFSKKWEVTSVPINISNLIGEGRCAHVYKYHTQLRRYDVIARRYKASTKDNVVVITVKKYKLINHQNVLRCRGYSVRPSTLFFPFCSVELPNRKEVHNIGEYIDYLNSVCNFELVNRLDLCLRMCEGLGYLHDNEFLHTFLSHKNVMFNGPVNNVMVMLSDFGEFNSHIVEAYEFEQVYRSPELNCIDDSSEASDIYAIDRS